ncbi:MAG TPA: hypothetical protein VJS92_02975, partial [Candidatus Polarisedimenticolaceae bacterium]|nr:hypothetical protein [Candidatus Polarisedimenticolaceae bacterium]
SLPRADAPASAASEEAPAAAPTPTEPRQRPADLQIVQADHEFTRDGQLHVFGELRNQGDAPATEVTARIVLSSPQGDAALDSQEVLVLPSQLTGGASGSFEAWFADPGREVNVVVEAHGKARAEPKGKRW